MYDSTSIRTCDRLYTAEQVRQLDYTAIHEFQINGFELMNRAARAAFRSIINHWPDLLRGKSLQVFCGGGNNGGDGYLVAMLAAKRGIPVTVLTLSSPDKLSGDARLAYEACIVEEVSVNPYTQGVPLSGDVLVDAMLGTGLGRDVSGDYRDAVVRINQSDSPVMAIDIPSGLCADKGIELGVAVKADVTVTFIGMKLGLLSGRGKELSGQVEFADLGVPKEIYESVSIEAVRLSEDMLSGWVQPRARDLHKGDNGHVMVVAGNHGMPGAAIMSAEAALFCGAGRVTVATRQEHLLALAARRPELMASGVSCAEDLRPLIAGKNLLVVGPGLGKDSWARELLTEVLNAECPVVVDADGLNIISEDPALLKGRKYPMILTPHPGEAARLLNTSIATINADRVKAAKEIFNKYKAVVVLKGAGTLVYDGQSLNLCSDGNPGMAVAGMGDVLSGVIAALSAQGVEASCAAALGVWLHATGADQLAQLQGERGMLALETVPHIRSQLNKIAKQP
ncbi:bifunctional ADP-dependent NAD(P)H-hydrate dehydratase/NAD(P)H-hydrate epimerase [Endozoicomonas arenosclerae]|uniref:bifunctional ADP-dependent NAD(P)H-hydrate dehydratase/NAD(P)H-hydrate epimerase n=1 Tax=Endozoicomonas arenosclerae TaxID=1633495 RepID=UPI0007843061|nr:bifunctional ADP-dependent NAD(P)H-hydrate dehydratase/NAD(P)H-hydrate epimerase [Endozoicomonas arenosclerae]